MAAGSSQSDAGAWQHEVMRFYHQELARLARRSPDDVAAHAWLRMCGAMVVAGSSGYSGCDALRRGAALAWRVLRRTWMIAALVGEDERREGRCEMRPKRVARQLWRGVALAGIGLAGGAALVTARHLLMTPQPLDSGLPGEGRIDRLHGGDMYYSVAGPADGRPIVLLHGFYPGASNYEYRAIFSRLAETYRVYAPDWLGFGMSERPALTHTGEFYASMLTGFLRDVVGAPAAVIAHGLACNIATRAASDMPALFDRLTLVAPDVDAGMRLDPTFTQTVSRLLQKLSLGVTPYALVSLRPALRLAAGLRSAVGLMEVDDETIDHLYASAHQFGGEYATLSLFTGELDLPMRQVFPLLETPTLIVVGARDARHSLNDMERLVTLNPQADLEVVSNAGDTVYLDQPTLFVHAMRRWLGRRVTHRAPHAVAVGAPASASAEPAVVARPVPEITHPEPLPQVAEPSTESAPDVETPTELAVKIVPVVETLDSFAPKVAGDPPANAPQELLVARTPDVDVMVSPPDRAQSSQPLTLEPTDTPPADANARRAPGGLPRAAGPDTSSRLGWQASTRMSSERRARVSEAPQSSTYRYAPEMGAHIVRNDSGRSMGRSPRHR